MSFGDHLEELRSRLILALVGVVLAAGVCLAFGRQILELVCQPLLFVQAANDLRPSLQVLSPTTAFLTYLKVGVLAGVILAMPWVLYQIWRFVESGLYRHERRFVVALAPASVALFVLGVLFLYFLVLPTVLHFFVNFNKSFGPPDLAPTLFQRLIVPAEIESPPPPAPFDTLKLSLLQEDPESPADGDAWVNTTTRRLIIKTATGIWSAALEPGGASPTMQSQFALDFYVSFVLILALAFGIAFETPVVVFFLAWSGIVSVANMAQGRRYVLLGSVVLAAVLTPPDVISQVLLAGPMYLLFELGLWVARTVAPGEHRPVT